MSPRPCHIVLCHVHWQKHQVFDQAVFGPLWRMQCIVTQLCCSTPRTKQDQAITAGEISRFAPPEPNMHLLPQQVLAVAIGNCQILRFKLNMSKLIRLHHGPISFSEWVGPVLVMNLQ